MRCISLSSRVVASKDLVAAEVADEVVILSLATGGYYGLNPVAASLWALVQEPATVADLRNSLLQEYEGVTAETCEREVISALSHMRDLGLIEVV